MKASEIKLPKDKFVLANKDKILKDKELETKPLSYFQDAFIRFRKNKGSIVAAAIIGLLMLYSIVVPIFSQYKVSDKDVYYAHIVPKWFNNIDFMDGCQKKKLNSASFLLDYSKGVETGHNAIKNQEYNTVEELDFTKKTVTMYTYRLDAIHSVGTVFKQVTLNEYQAIQKYQDDNNIQIIYPITELSKRPTAVINNQNANYFFSTVVKGNQTLPANYKINEDGTITFDNIYSPYSGGEDQYTSKMLVKGETQENRLYDYGRILQGNQFEIRINYYEYYKYYHKCVLQDKIKEPRFIFGTNDTGQDIFTCLASGARFSFILAIAVSVVNLIVGAIYGAIEGYYGGKVDIVMERIVEILSEVPFMIVISLLKYHFESVSHALLLFISFFLTGWIGMSGTTRMQFYRFKNQEYVLASRTLGAKDFRIMFKHIFPNSLGTIVTSSVLVIPGVIFSETSLSYLGIINLNSGSMTSVGTLLANAQPFLVTFPHMIVFPSVFISLLMLCFNLFGNGLRDAFNPSLRGVED